MKILLLSSFINMYRKLKIRFFHRCDLPSTGSAGQLTHKAVRRSAWDDALLGACVGEA